MAVEYFKNFPSITYKGKTAKNILLRAALKETVKKNFSYYLPLTIEPGERPDMISGDLYKDTGYDWLVRVANSDLVDPYFDWYLTDEQVELKIVKKYGSVVQAINTVLHYRDNSNSNAIINIDTYNLLSAGDKLNYTAVTAYDYETNNNLNYRSINVINPSYAKAIDSELEKKLNAKRL